MNGVDPFVAGKKIHTKGLRTFKKDFMTYYIKTLYINFRFIIITYIIITTIRYTRTTPLFFLYN